MKYNYFILMALLLSGWSLSAQTPSDGLMMKRGDFCTGFIYTNESWKSYWEGGLKRTNDNIGQLTSQSVMWLGNYGISNNLNVIVMLPWVSNKASKGVLAGEEGLQDAQVFVKYKLLTTGDKIRYSGFVTGSFSTPLSKYTPDYLPLSIGLASTTAGIRYTNNVKWNKWYVNAGGSLTLRSKVYLDRPSYYTGNELFLTNQVEMPAVGDLFFSFGRIHKGLQLELNTIVVNTLGGHDIRRQDMPFVSNRMNLVKSGFLVMYYPKFLPNLALRAQYSQVLTGRNVGQTSGFLAGILYTFHFIKETTDEK